MSVAIIARDEAAIIGRCLAQLQGAVDDLVVVDTGSTDATKAIAAHHGARVFDYVWHDDFAAARQFAFDQATGDWICWLDADDVVDDPGAIRASIAAAASEAAGAVFWRYVLTRDAAGEPGFTYWRERCVRNDGSYRWAGAVHEVLVSDGNAPTIQDEAVTIDHQPDPARATGKAGRNLRILAGEYAARQAALEPRQLFYLAREYADNGQAERAITTFEEYLAVATWVEERYTALLQLGALHRDQQEQGLATMAALRAIREAPLRPEAYFKLARDAYFRRAWDEVVHWTETGRRLPIPTGLLFVDHAALRSGWIIYYTNALYWLGRLPAAVTWTERGLAAEPGNTWHQQNLTYFRRVAAAGQVPLDRSLAPVSPTYAVIPVRDRHDLTAALLDQLDLPPSQVVLVDNGSVEPAAIRFAGRARVIAVAARNISLLWNVGLDAIASRQTGAYNVAVLNNDLQVAPNFLTGLANALRAQPARLIAYPDADHRLPAGWCDPAGRMTGFAFLLRGEAGLRADPQFTWWYGDDDLERRARQAGEVVRVGGLDVVHLAPNASTTADPSLSAQAAADEARFAAKWPPAP